MPSPRHEGILEVVRAKPALAAAALGLPEAGWVAVTGDMGTATALEIRADLVLRHEQLPIVLIVEVQLRVDRTRPAVWAMTAASAARGPGVDVHVAIVTPHDAVARWAREGFRFGPHLALMPDVLGPDAFSDPDEPSAHARVLRALLRARRSDALPAVQDAVALLHTLDDADARGYLVTMAAALRPAHRALLEAWMNQTDRATWPAFEAWEARVRRDGLQEGQREGAVMVLRRLLTQRFGEVPPHVAARIAHADAERVADWSAAALTAPTLDDVFRA